MESTAQQSGVRSVRRLGEGRSALGHGLSVGLLLSVGTLAGAAQAQVDLFEPIDAAFGRAHAWDEEIGGTDQNWTRDTWDPFSITANADDQSTASSWRLGDAIGATAHSYLDGYIGVGSVDSRFRVTQDVDVLIQWNFNADGNDFGNEELRFWQIERGTGMEFPLLYENSGMGSVSFSLTADDIWDYRLFGYTVASGGSGLGFVSLSPVPAPASAALLGLGGLVVARRRR